MAQSRKITTRELWLVSILPAALVLILSAALPGPNNEIASATERLEKLTSGEAHAKMDRKLRLHATEQEQVEQQLAEFSAEEEMLRHTLAQLRSPGGSKHVSMAAAVSTLAQRMAMHDVHLLAMENASREGEPDHRSGNKNKVTQKKWQLEVAATWPAFRAALNDLNAFPPDIALLAISMHNAQSASTLRRWELIVKENVGQR
jgi:hypothetical protein